MKITEVRIKLMEEPNDRLQAFCSITLDGSFVVRDLKIIQGSRGPFVAMPSRKLNDRCPQCGGKNDLRAAFCSGCGKRLDQERATRDPSGRAKLYADIAHPINSQCREMIQACVLQAYEEELLRAQEPGYVCRYDDYGESDFAQAHEADPRNQSQMEDASGQLPRLHIVNSDGSTRRIDPADCDASAPNQPAAQKNRDATPDADGFGAGVE